MGDSRVDDLIAIGRIVRVHGIKGELVVIPLTDDAGRFEDIESAFLEGTTTERLAIRSLRFHKNQVLISFEGIDDRDKAESRIGDFVSLPRAELVELPENTFFQFELLGMEVYSDAGEFLGTIREVIEMPANDLWRIEGENPLVIPATENVIVNVDREKRRITVHLIEGLLDIQQ